MKRLVIGLSAVGLLVAAPGVCPAITVIDPPGAESAWASAIEGNNIVGSFRDATGVPGVHGFLYDGTNWTTLDFPGVPGNTYGNGIEGNTIVGTYWQSSVQHGYIFDGSDYTSFDKPGAVHTSVSNIDGNNLVGSFRESDGVRHGYFFDGTAYVTIDPPGSLGTFATDSEGTTVIGHFYDATDVAPSYIFDGVDFVTLNHPDGLPYVGQPSYYPYTVAQGMDGTSIVGYFGIEFFDGTDYQLLDEGGFLFKDGEYTTLRVPGALSTQLDGIQGTTVVGHFDDGTTLHAFVADVSELMTVVPEPSTFAIWSSSLLGLLLWRRRR